MKQCSKCKEVKSLSEFNKHKGKVDGYQYVCKICEKIYKKEYYENNKDSHVIRNNKSKDRNRKFLELIKEYSYCIICGESHPATLDFHHRNPEDKKFSIAKARTGYSLETIQKEIDKCDVLCSNCHRKLHYEQGGLV